MTITDYPNVPDTATDSSWPATLTPAWIAYLENRAVRPGIARQRGYDVLLSGRRKANLDGRFATMHGLGPDGGLYIPLRGLLDPYGDACQLRIENPQPDRNGKVRKFRVPDGQRNVLATHPATIDLLGQPNQSIIIAEGITRVDALAGYRIPAVGLTGCNNWKGGSPPRAIPDFDALGIRGNRFLLAFDGDVTSNRDVYRAAQGLADLLIGKGADAVSMLVLPDGLGLDDWLAREGFANANEVWAGLLKHSRAELGTRPARKNDPGNGNATRYPWYDARDFVDPWECTPDADCMRIVRRYADRLLVVRPHDGTLAYLRTTTEGGVWAKSDGAIDQMIADTALEWAQDAVSDKTVSGSISSAAVRWQKRNAKTSARNAAQASVDRVVGRWRDDGAMPSELTVCDEYDLDDNTRYLGAPNGVIDLHTGRMLTGLAARECLVSRSLPDPYDADATDPAVEKLFAYFPDDAREWLLTAIGHALRGRPNRRDYLLVGQGGSGKSTLFGAVAAALGDHAGFIPVGAIAQKKYAGGPEPEMEAFTNRRVMFYSEPPSNLDYQNTKRSSGGDTTPYRKMRSDTIIERRTTATRVFACNPDDVPRLPWHLKAMYDRLRALPYPSIPEDKQDLTLPDALARPRARQALAALLVRHAIANPTPPEDIPSVATLRRELRDASIGEAGEWLQTALVSDPDGVSTTALWEAARSASGRTDDGRVWGHTRTRFTALARQILQLPAPANHRIGPGGKIQKGWRGWRLATDEERQTHFEQMLEGDGPATRCAQCESDNAGRPLTPDGLCAQCAVAESDENRRRMPRVAPAAAIETLANTSPREMAAVRALVSPTDAERAAAALDVLTNRLERTAQNVAAGATMGAQTPDQLVNHALPQYWDAITGLAAEGFDAETEEETGGHRDG